MVGQMFFATFEEMNANVFVAFPFGVPQHGRLDCVDTSRIALVRLQKFLGDFDSVLDV